MSNRLPSTRTTPTPAQVEERISALHGRLEAHPVLPTRCCVRRDRAATTAERRVLSDVAERLRAELTAASNPRHVDTVVTRVLLGFEQGRGRGDDEGYRQTLLALHRGLDGTDGRRVLADDLPGFLDRHPAFRAQGEALARFFSASRRAFFGRQTAAARESWPFAEAEATLRRLAAAERTA